MDGVKWPRIPNSHSPFLSHSGSYLLSHSLSLNPVCLAYSPRTSRAQNRNLIRKGEGEARIQERQYARFGRSAREVLILIRMLDAEKEKEKKNRKRKRSKMRSSLIELDWAWLIDWLIDCLERWRGEERRGGSEGFVFWVNLFLFFFCFRFSVLLKRKGNACVTSSSGCVFFSSFFFGGRGPMIIPSFLRVEMDGME